MKSHPITSFKGLISAFAVVISLAVMGLTFEPIPLIQVQGSITGKVAFEGQVPSPKPIDMSADPACAKMHKSPIMSEELVVGRNKGLAHVFVRVKNAP